MLQRSRALFLLSTTSLTLCGCHHLQGKFGTIPPAPLYLDSSGTTRGYASSTAFNDECIAAASKIDTDKTLSIDDRKQARNRELARRLMAVRQSHAVYTGRVVQHKATFDTAADVLLAASTAVSAIEPGTAIGATSTALLASKVSVDKNFYDDLSRTALLIDIYKNTQAKDAAIEDNFKLTYEEYPLSKGCADIDRFFYAASATNAVGEEGSTVTPTTGEKPKGDKPISIVKPSAEPEGHKGTS